MSENGVPREELHLRQLDLRFYSRSDGLYEVEGRLVDRKCHAFRRQLATEDTPAGVPLHDIVVRLVVDESLLVHDAQAQMHATPFAVCMGAADTLAPLKGLRIGPGWNKQVRDLLRGAASCTHVVELLGPLGTTALQGLAPKRLAHLNDTANDAQRRARVDSCFAYSAKREVVARLWPDLHQPPDPSR